MFIRFRAGMPVNGDSRSSHCQQPKVVKGRGSCLADSQVVQAFCLHLVCKNMLQVATLCIFVLQASFASSAPSGPPAPSLPALHKGTIVVNKPYVTR